jgi:hypothetical protein
MSRLSFVVLLALAAWLPAYACTRAVGTTLESSFDAADGVVLAEVLNGARTAATSDVAADDPVETVAFKVLLAWKGNLEPGSILEFETATGPGSCGMSIDPEMKLLVTAPPKQLRSGGIWILFLSGASPYTLDEPSGRVGAGAERNLGRLHELAVRRSSSR